MLAGIPPARADDTLQRIRTTGVVHCGAEERPGFATEDKSGRILGLGVELCRAIAVAVSGPDARSDFHLYEYDFDAIRTGGDDVAFLTGDAIAREALAPRIIPGPVVFVDPIALMVPEASPIRRIPDLADRTVCLIIASAGQRVLEAVVERLHLTIRRLSFREEDELRDAYNVQRCDAAVGEATGLAALRQSNGINHLSSRLVAEPLALEPVIAATGIGDGHWAAQVAWLLDALIVAGASTDGGTPDPQVFGLHPDWRENVMRSVGSYGDMLRRNVTQRLGLAPGPNAPWPQGLLLTPSLR